MVDHGEDQPSYDPTDPMPPERAPPLRSTAPQSAFELAQVGTGLVVLLVGLAITFAVPLLLA